MRWIRRSFQIGQAVRNVGRLRQIIRVFAKYGFVDIVDRMNLTRFLSARLTALHEAQSDRSIQERLRLSFEELGPTFVKLGQLLSTRSDLLPPAFIDEFTKLQDNVQPLPYERVRQVIESEWKKPIESVLDHLDSTPLASASIGQVHAGRLKSGEEIVVKVQRPEISKVIDTDVSLLQFLAGLLERYVPETRIFGPKIIVNEFFRTLSLEIDFLVEANNTVKIAANLAEFPNIVIPHIHKEWSTSKVMMQEKLNGIRVNDVKALDAAGVDRKALVEAGARAFFKSVMIDGLFHGDLHGGNLFVLPGNKLGIIDFGIVGRLSDRSRARLASMVVALLKEDYENLCYEYAELGSAGASIDFEGFEREVRNTLSPYLGLTLEELNMGKVLIEATRIATKYQISTPGDWMLVFKAMFTMEGMGRALDPKFDIISVGQSMIGDLMADRYNAEKFGREIHWIGRDMLSLMRVLPRQIRWMFRKFNANDFAFEVKSPQLDSIKRQLERNSQRTSQSLITASLIIAAAIALPEFETRLILGYPAGFVIFAVLAAFFLVRSWWKS